MSVAVVARPSRIWIAAAAASILTALSVTGWSAGWVILFAGALIASWSGRVGPVLAVAVVAVPALLIPFRDLEVGEISAVMTLGSSPRADRWGWSATARLDGVDVLAELPGDVGSVGQSFRVTAFVSDDTAWVGGRRRRMVSVETVGDAIEGPGLYVSVGSALRSRVVDRLGGGSEARSLLAGFLVGDTSGVSEVTEEAMRKAGLSHFVAVSGSNVVLYLGFVALLALPFGIGPRRRAAFSLVALPVFVVATGFEPSVLRASAMAAIVLVARVFGIALDVWQVISLATVAILAIDPWLVRSVGFQLSLAATCGVVAGTRLAPGRSKLTQAVALTAGAQLAVSPILLLHFGSLPVLGPLSNLVAAPLVSGATVLGMAAVAGIGAALAPAEWLASIVVDISHVAAGWPQVGLPGLLAVLGMGVLLYRWRFDHPNLTIVLAAASLVLVLLPRTTQLGPGDVVFLDVGQGDAILISGGEHRYALVDGGRDPALIIELLRSYGVRNLDLVVMTHGDADHAAGLFALAGHVGIGEVWERTDPHDQSSGRDFVTSASTYGVPIRQPAVGSIYVLGSVSVEVIAPARRFESPNDQSIVLMVNGPARRMLLSGDIETHGQVALPDIDVDVLQVPHHGAGTSDRDWLMSTGAVEAVISVGVNDFGHPVEWVVESLRAAGVVVRRTDIEGNVIVDLSRSASDS